MTSFMAHAASRASFYQRFRELTVHMNLVVRLASIIGVAALAGCSSPAALRTKPPSVEYQSQQAAKWT